MNSRGIPPQHTWAFDFNNLDDVAQLIRQLHPACVILEPILAHPHTQLPALGYLQKLQALCQQSGVLLIFDETVTGFRCHLGGAQALYNVTPDLACFGKALANGWPLSALVGRADVMRELDHGVFFSTTNGGETASLAAASATLHVLERSDAIRRLGDFGTRLADAFHRIACGRATMSGYPQRPVMCWTSKHDEQRFLELMLQRHILMQGPYHNLMLAHLEDPQVFDQTVEAYAYAFANL